MTRRVVDVVEEDRSKGLFAGCDKPNMYQPKKMNTMERGKKDGDDGDDDDEREGEGKGKRKKGKKEKRKKGKKKERKLTSTTPQSGSG